MNVFMSADDQLIHKLLRLGRSSSRLLRMLRKHRSKPIIIYSRALRKPPSRVALR